MKRAIETNSTGSAKVCNRTLKYVYQCCREVGWTPKEILDYARNQRIIPLPVMSNNQRVGSEYFLIYNE